MEYKRGNAAFSGYGAPYPYNMPPVASGFTMGPIPHPEASRFQYSQGQYPSPVALPPTPEVNFMNSHFPLMQGMRPALVGPTGQVHILQTPPVSAPNPHFSMKSKGPETVSPLAHRSGRLTLDHLKKLESESHTGNSYQSLALVPEAAKSIDKVALPSEMPIGSLAHFQVAPKWGVLKISNIPYSITKLEITQFLGRQARLITPENGCAVHIIMERSTAKTMDCYVEFQTQNDAKEAVTRINRMHETGRIPRLGNRHIDVELSSQDALLKDMFPRAKCVRWKDGVPFALPNTDPYSTGFTGFFTSEEIVGAIRHAEVPHRSPFCAKCPQRTYESSISTLYKFPWFATKLYTVHDRNSLFEMVNRQIKALVARVKKSNTVGLDQRLLRELLKAGLNCPAFNERQKYTLCVNSEELSEILKFDMGKWFPFDTLVKMPKHEGHTLMYYAGLMSKGPIQNFGTVELPNNFPVDFDLNSPYGPIWFEWELEASKTKVWEDAVQQEMFILRNLVIAGWMKNGGEKAPELAALPQSDDAISSSSDDSEDSDLTVSPHGANRSNSMEHTPYRADIFATPSRRASDQPQSRFNPGLFIRPASRPPSRPFFHRNTLSSPTCLPSSGDPFFN